MSFSKPVRRHVQSESDKPTDGYGMRRRLGEFVLGKWDNLVTILQNLEVRAGVGYLR
jgi:hypothetical protein